MELFRLIQLESDLCVLLCLDCLLACLEITSPPGLPGVRVLASEVDFDEGVGGSVDVEVEVERDIMVVDYADDVLGEDCAVEVLVGFGLVCVGVGCSFYHQDPA